jgi:uncharacterized circularly permuted ATP-grasp superfamily protein
LAGAQPGDVMRARREEAEMIFRRVGITFAVYGAKDEDGAGTERLIPFDLIPRVIPAHEWARWSGPAPARDALNRFIHDVYHGQEIIKAGVVPAEQMLATPSSARDDRRGRAGRRLLAHRRHRHRARPNAGRRGRVLRAGGQPARAQRRELHAGNRKMMMRLFPDLFSQHRVAPVAHYPDLLLETLRASPATGVNEPTVVVLTPGMYNSAYFEHAFLAQQMGVELVEGQDLFVKDGFVYMRTTRGPKRVDVIYRRVDDDFLDPQVFRPTPRWAAPACWTPTAQGNVTLCNAIGTGRGRRQVDLPLRAQDDRVLPGREADPEQRADLHVPQQGRPAVRAGPPGRTGGQGGARRGRLRHAGRPGGHPGRDRGLPGGLLANPSNYIAQPTLSLSTCPTFVEKRHRAAPHRPAALRAVGQDGADGARRADPRGAEGRLAGGQLVAGRRHQGHLGAGS